MSGSDGVLMGRAELERAFTRLGERLVRRGVVADIFVVGGAAMALAYDAKRVTRDVDAMFVPHGVVLDEARAVADDLGLPPWWLNEQASVYVSGKIDPGRRRVFDHPGLRVMAASPEHIFAMKHSRRGPATWTISVPWRRWPASRRWTTPYACAVTSTQTR
ncbi:hypothetical protein [Micromonospora sp. NPDC126480]|uniref:hypothetical protein n=1 Tax=Micromonospora sp. NPDC126480 TaxID=3155312 RepID=UPI003321F2B8